MLAYQGALISRSAVQTIPKDVETLISWDIEKHDIGEYHNTPEPTQMVIPTYLSGVYNIYAAVDWTASNFSWYHWVQILVNDVAIARYISPSYPTYNRSQLVSTSWILTEGDAVTIKVFQNSTGNIDIARSSYTPLFGVDLLGVIQ